jgi:hypothetical protein
LARSGNQVSFRLKALMQGSSYVTGEQTTNRTATATNTVSVSKSTVAATSIDSSFILALLENSFQTNFPAGARLVMSGTGNFSFLVTDRSGSKVLLDATSVLSIAASLGVNSGQQTATWATTNANSDYSCRDEEVLTELATLSYNDSSLVTRDQTHSNFYLTGILVQRRSTDVVTEAFSESLTLQGAGAGMLRGQDNLIVEGILAGTVSGVL